MNKVAIYARSVTKNDEAIRLQIKRVKDAFNEKQNNKIPC